MPFTKETAIICIGHLPEHINRKIELLTEAGYTKAIPLVTRDTTPEAIKALLKTHADDGLFLVGGAMRGTYVELMADLDAYIASEVIAVAAVTAADHYLAQEAK